MKLQFRNGISHKWKLPGNGIPSIHLMPVFNQRWVYLAPESGK